MVNLKDITPDFVYNVALVTTPILIFIIGMFGMFFYRNSLIRMFIALELMILSANLLFVEAAFYHTDTAIEAQVVVPIVLAVAACEAAVGLGLLVVAYRAKNSIAFDALNKLKG